MASKPIAVLKEDGTTVKSRDPGFDDETVLRIHRWLVAARAFDERALNLQRQGRIGFFAPAIGQEAAQVGSALAVDDRDWLFPAYRELAVALVRGMPMLALAGQLFGNQADVNKGRQMPNHYGYRDINFVTPSSPIGTHIIHAAGWAVAERMKGGDGVAVTYFGDGATSSNDFHTGMNFAGVYQAPVIFLCQNNGWAISLPVERQTAAETLADKALGYGVPGVRVDGNDVLAMYTATKEAVERARRGEGPTFIEALTYRMGPHSSSDDPTRYRSTQEVAGWQLRDPLLRFRRYLEQRGIWDDQKEEALWADVREEIAEAVKAAEAAEPVPVSSLFDDIYETPTPQLEAQRAALLEEYRQRKELGEMGHFEGEFPL